MPDCGPGVLLPRRTAASTVRTRRLARLSSSGSNTTRMQGGRPEQAGRRALTGIGSVPRWHGGALTRWSVKDARKKLDAGIATTHRDLWHRQRRRDGDLPAVAPTPYHSEKARLGGRLPRALRPCAGRGDQAGHHHSRHHVPGDWMPTFVAAAGEPNIVAKLKQGTRPTERPSRVIPMAITSCRTSRASRRAARGNLLLQPGW